MNPRTDVAAELTGGTDRVARVSDALESSHGVVAWTQHVVELADQTGRLAFRAAVDVDVIVGERAATVWTVAPDTDRWELEHVDDATDGYGGKLTPTVELTTDPDHDGGDTSVVFHISRRDPTVLYVRYDQTLHWRGVDPYARDAVRVITDRDTLPDSTEHAVLATGGGPYLTDEAASVELVNILLRSWCRQLTGRAPVEVSYVSDGPSPDWLKEIAARAERSSTAVVMCSECMHRSMGFEAAVGRVERGGEDLAVCPFHVRPGETLTRFE